MKNLPRLLYLASILKEKTPEIPRELQRYVAQADVISTAKYGLDAASQSLGIPLHQLRHLAQIGSADWDAPSPQSFRLTIANEILQHPEIEKLSLEKRLRVMGRVDRFANDAGGDLFEYEEYALDVIQDPPKIPKWNTGFDPLDETLGGVYQALLTLMAAPGTGKTSTMITLAECIKRRYPEKRILFFEIELAGPMMLGRMEPVFARGNPFTSRDKLYAGFTSIQTIMDICLEDIPEGGQVVFVDSPDVMAGADADGSRRFILEAIFRDLIKIKQHSDLVVAASQPRRQDAVMTQNSVSESASKRDYSDIIIGITPMANGQLKLKSLKNRFGIGNQERIYDYDYEQMTFSGTMENLDDWG